MSASPQVSKEEFRNLLGGFPSGVTVVTTLGPDGLPAGFTATSFTSVSIEPPLVLVCLDVKADCHRAFELASAMGINVLAADQAALAKGFAMRGVDKFEGVRQIPSSSAGVPLLAGACVHLTCEIQSRVSAGDHTILIGRVLEGARSELTPLVYHDRAFGQPSPLPAAP